MFYPTVQRSFISLMVVLVIASPAAAWGPEGHRITAAIGEMYLHEQTRAAIRELLGNQSMADVANWADEIRDNAAYDWTKPLHYINVPRSATRVEMGRDCENGMCILGAIESFAGKLRDRSLPVRERREALMFLIHFIADVHQPMHVSYRDDLGGNRIDIILFGSETNLHRVWDSGLINRRMNDGWLALARELHGDITLQHLRSWSASPAPLDWANESLTITRRIYAELPRTSELDQPYYERNIPFVLERLAMAGVRTAMMLNNIFAPDQPLLPIPQAPETPEATPTPAAPSEAMKFVTIVMEGECGEGQFATLVNSHESRLIEVKIRRSWTDRDKPASAESTVVVRAGDRRRLGCTHQRLTREVREFTWEILSADFK